MTYRLDEQVGYILRLAHQRAAAVFQDVMASSQLTPTQFSALVRLSENGEISQNRLGRLTGVDPATIQGVIRRLAKRELIDFRNDPVDRRRRLWRLSAAGEKLIGDMIRRGPDVSAAVLAPLTHEEQRVFLTLLKRLI